VAVLSPPCRIPPLHFQRSRNDAPHTNRLEYTRSEHSIAAQTGQRKFPHDSAILHRAATTSQILRNDPRKRLIDKRISFDSHQRSAVCATTRDSTPRTAQIFLLPREISLAAAENRFRSPDVDRGP
jgi:hypothetical protein